MKTPVFRLLPVMVWLIFFNYSKSFAQQNSSTDHCGMITVERPLNYGNPLDKDNVYCYWKREVIDGRKNVSGIYKYSDGSDLDHTAENISLGHIRQMIKDISSTGHYDEKTYAAVKMTYGFVGKKIVIIYQPVLLHDMNDKGDETIEYTGKIYTENSWDGSFTKDDSTVRVNEFVKQIRITHFSAATAGNKKFIQVDDWPDGDIRSCIIPIQEILDMHDDNPTANPCDDNDMISFEVIANNFYKYRHKHVDNYKMHVVVYNNKLSDADNMVRFDGLAVDFTQMCPPRCSNVYVRYDDNKSRVSRKRKRVSSKK